MRGLSVEGAEGVVPYGQRPCRVVVLGGGLSGLTAAYRLSRSGSEGQPPPEVVLLEARERVGGAIWTDREDGFTFEGGADSFITDKPDALELCLELGLELIPTQDRHRRSFVVHRGRLEPVPEGFVLMAPKRLAPLLTSPILSWRGKLRLLMEPFVPCRSSEELQDESLASFVKRRLGREALERLVQPLVAGIYTADPNELSLKATLPRFLEMERSQGGLIRAARRQERAARAKARTRPDPSAPDPAGAGARYGMFVTPAQGMASLVEALVGALPPGTLRLRTPVRRIVRTPMATTPAPSSPRDQSSETNDPTRPWRVELLDGPAIEADAVVLAVEAHAAARLVDGLDSELARLLRSIPYASSAILNLSFRRDQIAHPLNGFGAVVAARENRDLLAVSFTSVKFPHRAPKDHVLMRAFFGGATRPDLFDHDDEALRQLALSELSGLLGIQGEPIHAKVARHARAMPQYILGHLDRVEAIEQRVKAIPGLVLAGNALRGVGVPDCVRSATRAAQAVVQRLGLTRTHGA